MKFDSMSRLLWLAFAFSQIALACEGQDHAQVKVKFVVTLSESAVTDKTLFLAGNHDQLGAWRPDGLKLTKNSAGEYIAEAQFPAGTELEFKVTGGDWSAVEKNAAGQEIENRKLKVIFRSPIGEGETAIQECKLSVLRWASSQGAREFQRIKSTVVGRVNVHEPDASINGSLDRRIAVWLPPQYERQSHSRFPVLYMHDGQNLFDAATSAFGAEWQIDETATRLIEQGKIEPLIIVGIWNTRDRIQEYTPTLAALGSGGEAGTTTENEERIGGEQYLEFLVKTVKPMVDEKYRTRPEREFTAIGGSSLGGLISLYAGVRHSEIFSRFAVVSPALGWNDEQFLKKLEQDPMWSKKFEDARVWIDMGTQEGSTADSQHANVERTRRLVHVMKSVGLDSEKEMHHLIVLEGRHNESAWAERCGAILEFLFPKQTE